MATETCRLTLPVALILVTLVTVPGLPAFCFPFSFGIAFGSSFREQ
jgi:hypothetical protein